MTPDLLHYVFVAAGWIAMTTFLVSAVILKRRLPSRWSDALLAGLCTIALGQAVQQFAPIHDLPFDEFKGIVVSTGRLPILWYLGSLMSAAGALVTAAGFLGIALGTLPARSRA